MVLTILVVLLALVFPLALAQRMIVGVASVVDGDTLEIQGVRIRLAGVDAPESAQLCLDTQGRRYRCGARVANALAAHLAGRTVTCRQRGTDRFGRALATCVVGEQTVGGWLVSQGYAFIDPRFASDYRSRQVQSSRARAGLWAGRFQNPWEWRRVGASAAWRGYGRVAASPAPRPQQRQQPAGEVYFANCSEARAAGAAPILAGQPGYRSRLDRDGDGVACE